MSKSNDLDIVVHNTKILERAVRENKDFFIKQRHIYFHELERLLRVAYINCRTFTINENNVLETLYKKYLRSYFKYIASRITLYNYTKQIKWLYSLEDGSNVS